MDPVTLAAVSVGAAAGGGALKAVGSIFSGSANKAQYKYQQGIAIQNSKIQQQNADYARFAGAVEEQQIGMRGRAQLGTTRAIQSASGFNINFGSPAAVQASEREITGENTAIDRANTARKAYGYEIGAAQDVAQAGVYGKAAQTSVTAGEIGAGSSILGAVASVSDKWLQGSSMFGSNSNALYDDDSGPQTVSIRG